MTLMEGLAASIIRGTALEVPLPASRALIPQPSTDFLRFRQFLSRAVKAVGDRGPNLAF